MCEYYYLCYHYQLALSSSINMYYEIVHKRERAADVFFPARSASDIRLVHGASLGDTA